MWAKMQEFIYLRKGGMTFKECAFKIIKLSKYDVIIVADSMDKKT